jgi:superfamily II DNA/RNA helicase
MDKVLLVPMTEAQAKIHTDYQNSVAQLLAKWQRQGFLHEKDRQNLMIFLNLMRMVCDSTYVLDQETRHDTKIEELMNILEEAFAAGTDKVVVFSQWERMTRIVARELESHDIGYCYLHGGVPSADRGTLFDEFNNTPSCRVFLSTDAGGVGLNLQAASMLINLDIPWNPAVLEQRIARIYRLGQKRNVSVINMVSSDTIEHKMLGLLEFKKGLAEGILDGGDDTVFMEESKFKVFMQTVESIMEKPVDGLHPRVLDEQETELPTAESHQKAHRQDTDEQTTMPPFPDDDDVPATAPDDTPQFEKSPVETSVLIEQAALFFNQLGKTLADPVATQKLMGQLVQTDETDGKTYLKIPVENPDLAVNTLKFFAGLAEIFSKELKS